MLFGYGPDWSFFLVPVRLLAAPLFPVKVDCVLKNLSFCMVDARVGGGTISIGGVDLSAHGLSPRGRGNRHSADSDHSCTGSIPAWAGEPQPPHPEWLHPRVYPRVGGGTLFVTCWKLNPMGLSPRGRGNRGDLSQLHALFRSIPAWAGEPTVITPSGYARRVYPRVGGGTIHVARVLLSG